MEIFLLILKIIGIILLSIIGILILLLLLILFVPIRYKAVIKKGSGAEDIYSRIKVSWLLSFVSANLVFKEKLLQLKLKLIGIPIRQKMLFGKDSEDIDGNIDKNNAKNKKDNKSYDVENEPSIYDISDANNGYISIESNEEVDEGYVNIPEEKATDDAEIINAQVENINIRKNIIEESNVDDSNIDHIDHIDIEDKNIDDNIQDNKVTFLEKLKRIVIKPYDFVTGIIKKIVTTVTDLYLNTEKTINHLSYEYSFYTRFLEDDKNKEALSRIKKELIRILSSIKPRYIKGDLHIGFEDPAVMGQVLAILSILYPVLPKKLKLEPDFENVLFEGNVIIKGRVTIFVLAYSFIRVYFDKNFKRLQRIYKKHKIKNAQPDA